MIYRNARIRAVMEQVEITPLKQIAKQPGIQSVYRIVATYADERAYPSIATLIYHTGRATAKLETIYAGFLNNNAILREISKQTYSQFRDALRSVDFELLYIAPQNLLHTRTLWCVEHATNGHYQELIIDPHQNNQPYCKVINTIDGYLPDAVREINK